MAKRGRKARYFENSRDGSGPFWGHIEGLHDQNEDEYGEKYDLATGRRIDNSTVSLENQGLYEHNPDDTLDDNDRAIEIIDQHYRKLSKGLADAADLPKHFEDDIA